MKIYIKKLTSIIFAILFCAILPSTALATNGVTLSSISAASYCLYSPNTNTFICEKNGDQTLPMASTTKIMTCLAVLTANRLHDKVIIPQAACGIEGSSIYLTAGEQLTVKDLLYALMLQSANDAAVALAIVTDGSIEAFVNRMNSLAEEIGLNNTHFANPHGLDDPQHYTTAKDLAILTSTALDNPVFKEIVATKTHKIPGTNGSIRYLKNHNKLLYLCEEAIGVKTGYTKKSGRCLVGSAEKNGITLISVTLNAPNDWNDHKTLFSFGYSILESIPIYKKNEFKLVLSIAGGNKPEIELTNNEDINAILHKKCNTITTRIECNRPLIAPIKAGKTVGKLFFLENGKIVGECSLIANETIEKVKSKGMHHNDNQN